MARINLRFGLLVACLAIFIGWGLVTDAKPIEKPEEKETPKEVASDPEDADDDADVTTRSKVQKHKKDENDCKREFHVEGACHPFHDQPEYENEGNNDYGDDDDGEDEPHFGKCCFGERRHLVVKGKQGKEVANDTNANSTARDDCCCHHCCHHDCHHCHHDCHHSCHHCGHHCHHCHHSHHSHHCHHCCGGHRRQGCGAVHLPVVHHVTPAIHHVSDVGCNVGVGGGTGVIANTGGNSCGHVCNNGDGGDRACGTAIHNVPLKVKVAVGPATSVHHDNGCGVNNGIGNGHTVLSTPVHTPVHTNGCTTTYGKSDISSGASPEKNDAH